MHVRHEGVAARAPMTSFEGAQCDVIPPRFCDVIACTRGLGRRAQVLTPHDVMHAKVGSARDALTSQSTGWRRRERAWRHGLHVQRPRGWRHALHVRALAPRSARATPGGMTSRSRDDATLAARGLTSSMLLPPRASARARHPARAPTGKSYRNLKRPLRFHFFFPFFLFSLQCFVLCFFVGSLV